LEKSVSKAILLILLTLCLAAGSFAGVELFSFRVFPVVDHSQLEWTTGMEDNFRSFIIERSSDGNSFVAVGQVAAKGSYSQYTFSDDSPLDLDLNRIFYYRLKMINRDGTFVYSEVREASLSFSAVQQTWGSIKAMFR
jgi:hypothetical protein